MTKNKIKNAKAFARAYSLKFFKEKSEIIQNKFNVENIRIYNDFAKVRNLYFNRERKAIIITNVAIK